MVPPADLAPLQTASITPPRPPQTTTAFAAAKREPTSSARAVTSGIASPEPQTETYKGPVTGGGR